MTRTLSAVALLALLGACGDGQPFFDNNGNAQEDAVDINDNANDEAGDGATLDVGTLLPGTDNPQPGSGIIRFEERNNDGGGLVTDVSYDPSADTFTVDNIGFDGANVYQRDNQVGILNGYSVFEGDDTTPDFLTGNPVSQIVPYRALVGDSTDLVNGAPRTTFAIVRTGGYVGFGFGGFIYQREGGVTLPSTGQATFTGDYAALRIFDGASGMRYVDGDMALDIDFEDFNANNAVKGSVTNRTVYFMDGTIDASADAAPIRWTIVEGVNTLTNNGEIVSDVFTTQTNSNGLQEVYFEGTFNGIIAGNTTLASDGGEIVGVINMIATDPVTEIRIQETGGAILSR